MCACVFVCQIEHIYSGALYGPAVDAMRACDPNGPLMINIVKLYPTPNGEQFVAFGRVFSGTVVAGQSVRVLGENYTLADEEDMAVRNVSAISVSQGRYRTDINRASAGNWVMLEGVDESIVKTATITASQRTYRGCEVACCTCRVARAAACSPYVCLRACVCCVVLRVCCVVLCCVVLCCVVLCCV